MASSQAPTGRVATESAGVRRRNREQTVEAILDAAETLLASKGPDGFGLAELGREAGVSFGLIHHYFGGKNGLLREVLRRTLRDLGRELRGMQDTGRFWEPGAPGVGLVFDTFLNKPGFSRLVAWGLLTGLLTAEDVLEEFRPDRDAVVDMVGEFRAGLPNESRSDAGAAAALLMSTTLGYSLLQPLLRAAYDWDDRSEDSLRRQLVRTMTATAKQGSRP